MVAIVATTMALIVGTLTALAIYRSHFFGKDAISLMMILPIALPGIVTGIALRSAINISTSISASGRLSSVTRPSAS